MPNTASLACAVLLIIENGCGAGLQSPQARIANSSSRNAVSFSSARTTKRFPSRCCDPRLRFGWQRDRDARAQGRFQSVLIIFSFGNDREG
jgi:hypothetical protein